MALSDGSHAATEDFSYFSLRKSLTVPFSTAEDRDAEVHPEDTEGQSPARAPSLFGISCTRQLDSRDLLVRPDDVTRSTVQKAVVVIADNPQRFGELREK